MLAAPSHQTLFRKLWKVSLAGARANLIPGIGLWIVGMIVVWLYYGVEGTRETFVRIAEIRESYGLLYSGVATAVFGAVIPFSYLWLVGAVPRGKTLSWGFFFLIFWSVRGMEVDLFYRFQAWLFGDDSAWQTIVAKVLFDQFVYSLLWAAPLTSLCYVWKDVDFSWSALRRRLNRNWLTFEVPSLLLSVWIVWIPATAIIYSLPLPLQIPLFNLVLCFYVLLVSWLAPEEEPTVGC